MKVKELFDGNKLIADFMGLTQNSIFEYVYKNQGYNPHNMKYFLSWDWLMPVLDKIEAIGETETMYGNIVEVCTTHVRIGSEIMIDLKMNPMRKRHAAWRAAVTFIKSYNEQKK